MVEQCQAESAKGSPVAEGGCEAEAKGVVYQGDYEIWTNSLVRCPKDKDVQILWSGYKDDEREDIFESLRSAGGCVLHSGKNPDTAIAKLLNEAPV